MNEDEERARFHRGIGLKGQCNLYRATSEAAAYGGIAVEMVKRGNDDLARQWARAAASYGLVIVGRDESEGGDAL